MTSQSENAPTGTRAGSAQRWGAARPPGTARDHRLRNLIGLPLLWAAAYFVPTLRSAGVYLLPSWNLAGLVVLPSLVAVAVVGASLLLLRSAARRSTVPWIAGCGAVVLLAIFGVIAVKVGILAAGYAWEDLLPQGGNFHRTVRVAKYALCLGMLGCVWVTRGSLERWNRVLSTVGIALGGFALVRLIFLWNPPHPDAPANSAAPALSAPAAAGAAPRRVIWVIFDETDFERVYGAQADARVPLPNFQSLARRGLFAADANSPASATFYSMPALIAGVPIAGRGLRLNAARLWLEGANGVSVPFTDATSLFGALHRAGRSASVLGFYEPYCKLFTLERCDSLPWPQVGGWDAALWANVPDFAVESLGVRQTSPEYFGEISRRELQLLPDYLARHDAVTLIHLNIPHLPATYADAVLGLPASADPLVEYSRNLSMADRILGNIMAAARAQTAEHSVMLIVSTDHWLRQRSYRGLGTERSRRIPFIVWRTDESRGLTAPFPLSTVHTAAMITDYLDGKISSQADILEWWRHQDVHPSFIAPTR